VAYFLYEEGDKGLQNLITTWLPMVEKALILDSSSKVAGSYPFIAEKTANQLNISDKALWQQIEAVSKRK
jgi:hypothetical protein